MKRLRKVEKEKSVRERCLELTSGPAFLMDSMGGVGEARSYVKVRGWLADIARFPLTPRPVIDRREQNVIAGTDLPSRRLVTEQSWYQQHPGSEVGRPRPCPLRPQGQSLPSRPSRWRPGALPSPRPSSSSFVVRQRLPSSTAGYVSVDRVVG